ncbi:23S rRNA (uracil(1939)-C(5))-methyltransferase RlmD [Hydrogenovibrio kuenenii]|uniref:23S rRNA (uracil(1939)-C(5))-methyltransferase RlmD n=1 Tax=Hydrogenovibrio kuenenii TaxID=63658 RepID=UPI000466507F|nr:23S rRNA (uracil(1939)-C(5))-methyltransferase RlmD [Hydrogenovibrio kuenenii]
MIIEQIEITDLSHDGRGIGRVDGKTIFIEGAIPGDIVSARIMQSQKTYDEAALVEVKTSSEHRVEPFCPVYNECGGCQLQHVDIAAQREWKAKRFLNALIKAVDAKKCKIADPLIGENKGYRRRARFVYGKHKTDKVAKFGFRAKASSEMVDIESCPLLTDEMNAALHVKREQCLPVASRSLKEVTLVESTLPKTQPVMLWSDDETSTKAHYTLDDLVFDFPKDGFIQVNAEINQKMVAQALEWLQLESNHSVLDLFCGVGNFTLPIAQTVSKVVGVEGDPSLVDFAQRNAKKNSLPNADFYKADLFDSANDFHWFHHQTYDRVLLDPGRQGAMSICQQMGKLNAQIIVYVSCNESTLIRDVQLLEKQGYQIRKAGFMDMFPHTSHAEVMVQLVKTKKTAKKKSPGVFRF